MSALNSVVAAITTNDLHFPGGVSDTLRHFPPSLRLDTIDYHPKRLPLTEAKLLRPPSTPATAAITASVAAIPSASRFLANLRPNTVDHHCSPYRAIVIVFRQRATVARLALICPVLIYLAMPASVYQPILFVSAGCVRIHCVKPNPTWSSSAS